MNSKGEVLISRLFRPDIKLVKTQSISLSF